MKTLKQQRFEKKLSKACKGMVEQFENDSLTFASRPKSYKEKFVKIVRSTIMRLADIARDIPGYSTEEESAEWLLEAFKGTFLHATNVLNGGGLSLSVGDKERIIEDATNQSMAIVKVLDYSIFTTSEKNEFFALTENLMREVFTTKFLSILPIHRKLKEEDTSNKWLNETASRVFCMALNKYTK